LRLGSRGLLEQKTDTNTIADYTSRLGSRGLPEQKKYTIIIRQSSIAADNEKLTNADYTPRLASRGLLEQKTDIMIIIEQVSQPMQITPRDFEKETGV